MPHLPPQVTFSPPDYTGFTVIEIHAQTEHQLFETVARIAGAFGGPACVEEFRPHASNPTRAQIEMRDRGVVH